MFTRLLLKPAIVTLVIAAGALTLIRAQAYDVNAPFHLRGIIGGCDLPCIFDIEPGASRQTDVVRTLRTHPWVRDVHLPRFGNTRNSVLVYWYWHNPPSPLIDHESVQGHGYFNAVNRRIDAVGLGTHISVRAIWQLFGEPDTLYANPVTTTVNGVLAHPHENLYVTFEIRCPIDEAAFWRTPVFLWLEATPRDLERDYTRYPLADWLAEPAC